MHGCGTLLAPEPPSLTLYVHMSSTVVVIPSVISLLLLVLFSQAVINTAHYTHKQLIAHASTAHSHRKAQVAVTKETFEAQGSVESL